MKTPLSYYGGKQQLAKTILGLIPPHRVYCEPFLGGAAIFFAK
ncbi:MAG: DNA adenine methylase, partial [Treponema sp.]|nr:DNA adenine methylase [Treponema sp.]